MLQSENWKGASPRLSVFEVGGVASSYWCDTPQGYFDDDMQCKAGKCSMIDINLTVGITDCQITIVLVCRGATSLTLDGVNSSMVA